MKKPYCLSITFFAAAWFFFGAGFAHAQSMIMYISPEECEKIGRQFNLPPGMSNDMLRGRQEFPNCTWGYEYDGSAFTPINPEQYVDAALFYSFEIKKYSDTAGPEKELNYSRDYLIENNPTEERWHYTIDSDADSMTLTNRYTDPDPYFLIDEGKRVVSKQIGTCLFEVIGNSEIGGDNSLLETYHPLDEKVAFTNNHPEFDHGYAKMSAQVDDIVRQGVRILSSFCGGESVPETESSEPEPDICKLPILPPGSIKPTIPPPAESPEIPHGPLCSALEAAAAHKAATDAELALEAAVRQLDQFTNLVGKTESQVRMTQSEILLTKAEIAQLVSLAETRKDAGLDFSEAVQGQKALQKTLVTLAENLERAKVARDQLAEKVTQANEKKDTAALTYREAIIRAARCQSEVEARAREEGMQARRAASEEAARQAARAMQARQKAAERKLQERELRERVTDFYKKQNAGLIPSSIRPPLCLNDFEEGCKAGDIKKEAPYTCSYAETASGRPVKVYPSSAAKIPDEHMSNLRTYLSWAGRINALYEIYTGVDSLRKIGRLGEGAEDSLEAIEAIIEAIGEDAMTERAEGVLNYEQEQRNLPVSGSVSLDVASQIETAQKALDSIEYIVKNTRMLLGIDVPVRVRVYEATESFSCKADGASWQVDWEKIKPQYTLARNEVITVEFRCPTLFYGEDYVALNLSSSAEGYPCQFPDERSEMPAMLKRVALQASVEALKDADAPLSDPRCPAEPPT